MSKKLEEEYKENFQTYVNYMKPKMFRYEDAEDVVQNVFLKMFSMTDEQIDAIADLKNYIYRSLRNMRIDYMRRKEYRNTYSMDEQCESMDIPTDNYIKIGTTENLIYEQDCFRYVDELMETVLTKREREAVEAIKFQGIKNREYAKEKNVHIGTILSAVHIGRNKLINAGADEFKLWLN